MKQEKKQSFSFIMPRLELQSFKTASQHAAKSAMLTTIYITVVKYHKIFLAQKIKKII
jgi:hypothetical protein